jgi:polyribonucleotide nucleotidyltransferase
MSQKGIVKTFQMPDGTSISIETGRLAKQADGSVIVRQGDCMLLATVVSGTALKPGQDFFPLSVDYVEKFYSTGRIPGSFPRRETKLSDYEVLISRLVDRTLRPLFPEDYLFETQVNIWMISGDKEVMPDTLAGLAASAALAVSDIPFVGGPISEVRVARIDGVFKVNPNRSELAKADLNIIIGASADNIVMIEGEMKEVSEDELIEAIALGHEAIKLQCKVQLELREMVGKTSFRDYEKPVENEELREQIKVACSDKILAIAKGKLDKTARGDGFKSIRKEFEASLGEALTDEIKPFIKKYFGDLEYYIVRDMVLNDRQRLDGRALDEIRPLWMEVNALPSPHGSAIFTRGETQALATVTLGGTDDEQMLDMAHELEYSKFLLHYNFPAFSTGEIKPNRGPGRREIGHGNLAKRSLEIVMPEECPYTIRVVSEVLESNGSSSMATTCAGSLALMDAGVKLSGGVSGIAMGMITSKDGSKYAILSDILGDEDHLGDMDFKVTGTAKGICGTQMDIKVNGLSFEVLKEALEQSRKGRLHILNEMNKVMSQANADYKPHAPRIEKVYIDKEFIGAIIGPGGKNIQELQKTTKTKISIEEVMKDGVEVGEIHVLATEKEGMDAALQHIKNVTFVPQVGDEFEATVKNIVEFGAFVEFMPGKEGLLHISEISHSRLNSMEGIFKSGDKVRIKIIGTDPKTGKWRLSRKVLLPKPEAAPKAN